MAAAVDRLTEAVAAAVTAATGVPAVVRKLPLTREGDAFPLAVVSPEAEQAEPATGDPDFALFTRVPVRVVLWVRAAGTLADGAAAVGGWRQAVRRALLDVRTLTPAFDAAGEQVDGADYDPRPPFDRATLPKGLDRSDQRVTYRLIEPQE